MSGRARGGGRPAGGLFPREVFLFPLFCLLFPAFLWFTPADLSVSEPPFIRVAIHRKVETVRLTVLAPCRIRDLKSGRTLAAWPEIRWKEARTAGSGIRIGQERFASPAVVIEPEKPAVLRVNARPYRGELILLRAAEGKLTVVNRLGLEEYLVGAIASETSSMWPMEALRAQAVVSRTMVAHRIWISRDKPFDVTADTGTHLYYGISAERGRTRSAVEETKGEVLSFEGELFSAAFHANCGGHTERASEIWSVKKPLPPLSGVPDPYCRNLSHYRWNWKISLADFGRMLGREAAGAGRVTGCRVLARNRSGRVRSVVVAGTEGETVFTGRRLRQLLGANRLKSLNFTVETAPGMLIFEGLGWGHGVGLCQWGSYGMARRGHAKGEILAHYFPGAVLRKLNGLPGFDG